MQQTGYKGIANIVQSPYFYHGFCKLWFTSIQNIAAWPSINPATQFLAEEPTLVDGASWYGPVLVPDKQTELEETLQLSAAGPFYRQKLECFLPGDDGYTRVNTHNLLFHEFVFIGLCRAGGYFQVFGNNENGLSLSGNNFSNNTNFAAARKLVFTADAIDPAAVLLSFSLSPSTPPPGWAIPGGGETDPDPEADGANQVEIIPFTSEDEISIPWTDARIEKFGVFPFIQVWKYVAGLPEFFSTPIGCDAPPGLQSFFTVYTPGTPGFIVIK